MAEANVPSIGLQDPNGDLNNAIQQWEAQMAQYNQDLQSFMQMIAQMVALAKKGGTGTEEAFQLAQTGVMPGVMKLQGESVAQLAATMNIGSAFTEFTTDTQNQINLGNGMTHDQAQQFINELKAAYDAVQTALAAKAPWLSASTGQQILSSLSKISGEFIVGATPDTLATSPDAASDVENSIATWIGSPTGISNGWNGLAPSVTGQQHMQNIQAAFQQWNNTQSAQAQSLTAQEQFATNTFNQYMNSLVGIFKSVTQQEQALVQNEKVS